MEPKLAPWKLVGWEPSWEWLGYIIAAAPTKNPGRQAVRATVGALGELSYGTPRAGKLRLIPHGLLP